MIQFHSQKAKSMGDDTNHVARGGKDKKFASCADSKVVPDGLVKF